MHPEEPTEEGDVGRERKRGEKGRENKEAQELRPDF